MVDCARYRGSREEARRWRGETHLGNPLVPILARNTENRVPKRVSHVDWDTSVKQSIDLQTIHTR